VSDGPRLAIFGPVPGSRFSVYQVPILDMINHRNGKWKNVESTTAHAGKDIRVYALRDIEKGEQLWSECVLRLCLCLFSFVCIVDGTIQRCYCFGSSCCMSFSSDSYNECLDEDCDWGAIKYTYITQHILMDYGFVEAYPRRFIFHVDAQGTSRYEDDFLTVEIDEDPDDPSKHVLDWHYLRPTEAQLEWISNQLKRLESLEDTMKKGLTDLTSEHEKNTIETYYYAYKEAFELSLKHKDDEISNKTTIVYDEDDDQEDEEGYDEDDDSEGDEL